MSIIQDALRRREQEAPPDGPDRGPPTFPIPTPSAAEPPPNPSSPPPPPPRAGRAPAVAPSKDRPGVVLVLLLLVAVGAAAYWFVGQRKNTPREAVPEAAPSTSAAPSAPASRWGQVLQKAHQVLGVAAQRASETDAVAEGGAAPAPPAGGPSEFQPVTVPGGAPPSVVAPPPAAPSRPADPRVRWPRFTVKGVIAPAGGMRGTVILNDETLQEGDYSEKNIRVVAVRGQEAFLEYEGQQRSYFAGQGER